MAKKTKITAVAIAKAMELMDFDPVVIKCGSGDNAIEVPVKPCLTIGERAMMVSDITNMVFINSGDGEKYCPAFKKFAIEFNIVSHFTNVSLPADSDKAYKFLNRSGLANMIAQALPDGYIGEIIEEALEAIDYRKQELLKQSKIDRILDRVLDVIDTLGGKIEDIDISQIMEFVDKNMPEFKGQIVQLISTQAGLGTETLA